MTDKHGMPQYDGMEYEELVAAAQFLWMENAELKKAMDFQALELGCMTYNRDVLHVENAKLRELAAGIGHLLFPLDVDYCAICLRDDINHPCPVHTVKGGECLYKTDLRELGIEVPE